MGLGIWHSCRKLHNFYLNGYEFCEHGIICALRCGVALVGDFLYWAFQVLEVHRAMRLIFNLGCEEKG